MEQQLSCDPSRLRLAPELGRVLEQASQLLAADRVRTARAAHVLRVRERIRACNMALQNAAPSLWGFPRMAQVLVM